MRTRTLFVIITAGLLLSVNANGKPKHKSAPPPAPASLAEPDPAKPAQALAPYINNLDQLLALRRSAPVTLAPFFDQASGRLVTLRVELSSERNHAAEKDRAMFEAAVATCDALARALDEREATISQMKSSASVSGSDKLGRGPRKDNLVQGIHGGDLAKAVGSVVERDREKSENKRAKMAAAHDSQALEAMTVNRWNQRAIELRRGIIDTYSRIQ